MPENLVKLQSSEKVDSDKFFQFSHSFMKERIFRGPYSAILKMSLQTFYNCFIKNIESVNLQQIYSVEGNSVCSPLHPTHLNLLGSSTLSSQCLWASVLGFILFFFCTLPGWFSHFLLLQMSPELWWLGDCSARTTFLSQIMWVSFFYFVLFWFLTHKLCFYILHLSTFFVIV